MPSRRIVTMSMAGLVSTLVGAGCCAQAANSSGHAGTLKERSSDKASDEQRVDNCKVPLDRRGSRPRPEGCAHAGTSTARPK